jgi:hypothetical protein
MARSATLLARQKPLPPSAAGVSLKLALRKLWTEHAVWTHQYIVASIAGSSEAQATAGRLLRNQDDIGEAVGSVYGKAAGAKLTKLLKEHILIAVDLLEAAKAGDTKGFAKQDKRWTANGKDIGAFLSAANPFIDKREVANLLSLHLKLTKDTAVTRLGKDWDAEIAAYDDILVEITTLADRLSDAIVAQFPSKFA